MAQVEIEYRELETQQHGSESLEQYFLDKYGLTYDQIEDLEEAGIYDYQYEHGADPSHSQAENDGQELIALSIEIYGENSEDSHEESFHRQPSLSVTRQRFIKRQGHPGHRRITKMPDKHVIDPLPENPKLAPLRVLRASILDWPVYYFDKDDPKTVSETEEANQTEEAETDYYALSYEVDRKDIIRYSGSHSFPASDLHRRYTNGK